LAEHAAENRGVGSSILPLATFRGWLPGMGQHQTPTTTLEFRQSSPRSPITLDAQVLTKVRSSGGETFDTGAWERGDEPAPTSLLSAVQAARRRIRATAVVARLGLTPMCILPKYVGRSSWVPTVSSSIPGSWRPPTGRSPTDRALRPGPCPSPPGDRARRSPAGSRGRRGRRRARPR
jgi:hypothetical protein